MISDSQIQEIKDRNRIEDVIREYIKLKPSGSGFTGLCPFHGDKNPSLSVSVSKQIFKCFSCGEGGDVVHFIQKYNNLTYPEALRFLADRGGIKIEQSSGFTNKKDEIKKKITLANKDAAKFFYSQIVKYDAPKKYLAGRGITPECVKRFGIGFAPDSWSAMTDELIAKGYSPEFLEKAGLSVKSSRGTYIDKFRNRVMIPIFDVNGNVIAFGGRVMDDSKPKYMNSAETELYTKGNHLFGLNFAKRSANRQRAIMVEGYMDCIALQNRGIENAVASLGTALTENQAKLIKRYFEEVVLCYDSDEAGINAALRAISVFETADVRVKIMNVPDGKDPDEFLRKHSPDEFNNLADHAFTAVEFKINILEKKYPADNMDTYTKFVKNSVNVLAGIEDKSSRDIYVRWFSKKYSVSADSLEFDVNRQAASAEAEKSKEEAARIRNDINRREREKAGITEKSTEEENALSPNGQDGEAQETKSSFKAEMAKFPGGTNAAARLFKTELSLPVLISEDVSCVRKFSGKISDETFYFTDAKKLYEKLVAAERNGAVNYGFGILMDGTDSELASCLVKLESETDLTTDITAAVEELLKRIKIMRMDAEITDLKQKLRFAGENGEEKEKYMQKINSILTEKGKIS